ncbi:S-adenosyl-L-methionine-dependent methyltransferase [Nemania serpens]|nr:S-adenosyl-L-methionine-dependent methyltransferase [Nemania serpens]
MPRLPPSLFRTAASISPHIATLLPACRTIASARSELRWIREHVLDLASRSGDLDPSRSGPAVPRPRPRGEGSSAKRGRGSRLRSGERTKTKRKKTQRSVKTRVNPELGDEPQPELEVDAIEIRVASLVARRGAGEPLQYVLETQPFAGLEVLCERGVLIPRAETEAWASMLADLLLSSSPSSSSSPCSGSVYGPRLRGEGGIGGDDDGRSAVGRREGKGKRKGKGERDRNREREFRILDLCSGTGCISLSLYARMIASRRGQGGARDGDSNLDTDIGAETDRQETDPRVNVRVFGFDIEPRAVRLARRNLAHNFPRSSPDQDKDQDQDQDHANTAVSFHQADIFTSTWLSHLDISDATAQDHHPHHHQNQNQNQNQRRKIDVLVSNPPYISQHGFAHSTGRSVRNHEPKLALVPPSTHASGDPFPFPDPNTNTLTVPESTQERKSHAPEDIFYARLLAIADALRPRIAVFEVGDMAQAVRVVEMATAMATTTDSAGSREEEVDGRRRRRRRWDVVEIWRDWPDSRPSEGEDDVVLVRGREVPVRGSGHGRVVFLCRGSDDVDVDDDVEEESSSQSGA